LFTNSVSHASLERHLLQAQTTRIDLETKLREKEVTVERLERDRRHFADRKREEREARDALEAEHDADRVTFATSLPCSRLIYLQKRTETELKNLRAQLSALQESHNDLQDAHSQLSLSTAQTISSQKSISGSLTSRNSLLEAELSSAQSLASSRLEAIHSLQDQLDELQEAKDEWARTITNQQG
jgi:mitotic spindle assembly checkpoint protein MAD1